MHISKKLTLETFLEMKSISQMSFIQFVKQHQREEEWKRLDETRSEAAGDKGMRERKSYKTRKSCFISAAQTCSSYLQEKIME